MTGFLILKEKINIFNMAVFNVHQEGKVYIIDQGDTHF